MMSFAQWGNALYSGDKSYRVVPNRKRFVGLAAAVIRHRLRAGCDHGPEPLHRVHGWIPVRCRSRE